MTITVIDTATALAGLPIPRFAGSDWLSTDLFGRDNLSHPRTNVRSEGGSHDHHSHRSGPQPWTGCVARSTSCWPWTRPNGPSTSCNARSWTSTPSPSSWPRYRPKPWPVFRYPRRRSVGRAPHHGDWLATSTRTPAGHAGWWVHTARALRDIAARTATARWSTGPSPSTMSGAIRSAQPPHHR